MPPIPVYSSSPISAAKAAGVDPQTADPTPAPGLSAPAPQPAAAATTTAATTTTQAGDHAYPPAQPGARPSLPVPTGVPAAADVQPTPTRSLQHTGPPPPQPGAAPVAPDAASHLPPPPKVGETLQASPPQTTAPPMPPQMSYQIPQPTFASYGGSSTSTVPPPAQTWQGSQPVQLDGGLDDLSHPPGYQQDVHAGEFSSHQRAAHQASMTENSGEPLLSAQSGEKAWDAAKKWASAAGETLVAAENEIWKRVNK